MNIACMLCDNVSKFIYDFNFVSGEHLAALCPCGVEYRIHQNYISITMINYRWEFDAIGNFTLMYPIIYHDPSLTYCDDPAEYDGFISLQRFIKMRALL